MDLNDLVDETLMEKDKRNEKIDEKKDKECTGEKRKDP